MSDRRRAYSHIRPQYLFRYWPETNLAEGRHLEYEILWAVLVEDPAEMTEINICVLKNGSGAHQMTCTKQRHMGISGNGTYRRKRSSWKNTPGNVEMVVWDGPCPYQATPDGRRQCVQYVPLVRYLGTSLPQPHWQQLAGSRRTRGYLQGASEPISALRLASVAIGTLGTRATSRDRRGDRRGDRQRQPPVGQA